MLLKRVGLTILLLLTLSMGAESVFAAPTESGFLKRMVTVGGGRRRPLHGV